MSDMQGIQYVSTGLTLAAFVAALVASLIRRRMKSRERLIALVSERERPALVMRILEDLHVSAEGLPDPDRAALAKQELHLRSSRLTRILVAAIVLAIIGAATYLRSRADYSPAQRAVIDAKHRISD